MDGILITGCHARMSAVCLTIVNRVMNDVYVAKTTTVGQQTAPFIAVDEQKSCQQHGDIYHNIFSLNTHISWSSASCAVFHKSVVCGDYYYYYSAFICLFQTRHADIHA